MDVYIIHDTTIISRKQNVLDTKKRLECLDVIKNIHVIEEFDNNAINHNEVIKQLIRHNKPTNPTEIDTIFSKFVQPLNINNISNYLKHVRAFELIVKADRKSIVLEDDVIIADDMEQLIEKLLKNDNDIVFCGQPFVETPTESFTPLKNFNDMTLLPSCESYLIQPKIAAIILKCMLPIVYNTNIAISYAINANKLSACKMYPNIFIDGSKIGKYSSHINTNNILLYNSSYNELYKIIQSTSKDMDNFNQIFENATHNDSPDMLYLKGLMYLKINKLKEAKILFDVIFEHHCKHKCTLNKSSSFMQNYINMFRVMQ